VEDTESKAVSPRALLVRMDDVVEKQVAWLWRDRVPLRSVTLLAGIGGLGKSQLALAIAAEVTRGELTASEDPVLLLTAEDDLEAVVKPRLRATGAVEYLVHALRTDQDLWLPDQFELLQAMVDETKARLIIIDPLMAYVDGNTDTHRDRDVRMLVRRLHEIAVGSDAAVLAVMHFKKGVESDALYRVSGAAGFGNAARSVLAAARDPNDEDQRVLAHAKNNYGKEQPVLRFRVEERGKTSAVVFGDEDATLSLRDVFSDRPGPAPDAQLEAAEFLRAALLDGARPAAEVRAEARGLGIASRTLDRAKGRVGVRSEPIREGSKITGWEWSLSFLPLVEA
jgi:hypothetical protein